MNDRLSVSRPQYFKHYEGEVVALLHLATNPIDKSTWVVYTNDKTEVFTEPGIRFFGQVHVQGTEAHVVQQRFTPMGKN